MRLLRERIPERTCEQVVDVRVRLVVEQVLDVPKNSSQDRNLQGTVEQIPDDPMLEKAEQLVEMPKTVLQDGIQQRTVEQIVDARVPQAVEELADVFRVFSQDRIQERTVEQTIPATSLAETIVVVPVIHIQGTTQRGVNTHAQHVVNAVEVEKTKIIELTVQRKKFIIQEKINQETKPVEFPQAQFLDKADDMPGVVQRQVSTAQTVQKAMEVLPLQFTDKVVNIPVLAQRQISMETVQKIIEISQLQCVDEVIDVPVQLVAQVPRVLVVEKTTEIPQLQVEVVDVPVVFVVPVPQVQVVKKTVEDPQLQIVEKTVENPETQIDTCLTCDAKCMVACETCVKDNMFMVPGEITVAGKMDIPRETLQQNKIFRVIKKCLEMTSGAGTALSANGSKRQQHTQGARQAAQERESEVKQRGEQGREEREEGRKGQRGRDQEGRKEERRAEEAELVEKDVTGWTEVTRKKKKMVQIFVKVDGGKTSMMEMKMSDKVDDIVKKIPISDQDVYVTSEGRVLRGGDELRKCGVRDGCTVEVMRRLRGGGRHKDKKNKVEKKQVAILRRSESPQAQLEQKDEEESKCDEGQAISEDVVQQLLERGLDVLGGAEALERLSEGSDDEVDKKMELFLVAFKKSCMLPPVLVEELEKLAKSEVTARRAEMKSQAAENVTKNEDEAEKVSRKQRRNSQRR